MDRLQLERDFWNKCAQSPDVDELYICDISTEECIQALGDVLEPGMILDIGCGVGRVSNQVGAVGIDISKGMIEMARAKEIFDDQYWVSDGRTIPFPAETFDSAYSMLLFQHLEGLAVMNYIVEAFRVLKPGGIFRFQFIEGSEHEPFSHHYAYIQMSDWLREVGFTVEKVDKGLVHESWTWITAVKP